MGDFKKPTTIMHVIGSVLMVVGMFLFDTGFLLLQISTYTYFWSFYWSFLFFGTIGTILGVLLALRGFRHFTLIWLFFVIALFALVSVESPLNDSYTQVASRPGCDDSGVGNVCKNNVLLFAGTLMWAPGMMISVFATIKGSVGPIKIKQY